MPIAFYGLTANPPLEALITDLHHRLINSDDELTATSGQFSNSYSYNANGEQTGRTLSGTAYTLAYDYDGQLTSISTGGSTVSSFAYDALGRRYSRTNGGTTTRFLYGPGGILCEKQGSSFTAAYAYGNGLIRKDGEYPMYDGLGSARTTCNSSQTVTATATTEGFGSTNASTGGIGSLPTQEADGAKLSYASQARHPFRSSPLPCPVHAGPSGYSAGWKTLSKWLRHSHPV